MKAALGEVLESAKVFTDGDWVESKDQDPHGDVRLVQLADIGVGIWLDKSSRFMTSQKAENLRCTYLEPGDLLVARMPDPLGRACIFPGDERPCVTVVDVCIIRPDKDEVEPRYLMHWFNSRDAEQRIERMATGTTRRRISRKNLGRLDVRLPPIEEQRRIAAVLDAADDLRTKRRQALAKLDTLTQSIFIDMFGNQQREFAEIGDFAAVGSGATPKKGESRYYEGGSIRWVTSGQLGSPYVTEWAALITEAALRETNVKLWPTGTLLVAMYGEGKTRGHCSELTFESTTNQACAAIVLHDKAPVSTRYLKTYLMSRYEQNRRLAAGGVQPNLNLGLIKAMKVPVPPAIELLRFDESCGSVEQQLEAAHGSLAVLDTLFASLQQRAFAGEL